VFCFHCGKGNTQTRADVPFTPEVPLLVCHGRAAETSYTPVNNRKYTLNSGDSKWTAESEATTIYLGSEKADVCGYYPYVERDSWDC